MANSQCPRNDGNFNCVCFREIMCNIKQNIMLFGKQCGDFCSNMCISQCVIPGKMCSFFSCGLADKDFFVDLEKGAATEPGANRAVDGNTTRVCENKDKPIQEENGKENICAKCYLKMADVVILPCGHGNYCNDCLEQWSEKNDKCPTCGVKMTDVVQYI